MRPKSLILLALALGCGLIAAVGINQILARPSNDVQTVGIVVAKREIKKGDMIKPDDIRLQEWHVDSLPEGAIQKIDDLAERRVKSNVVPGEAILESKLVGKGVNDGEQIPAGMKGVAIKVDDVSGGGGLINPGDNVDVMLHVDANPARGIAASSTKVMLKNIKVHAVDSAVERREPGEPPSTAKNIMLLVTPKQAAWITHATEIGKVTLILRSAKDGDGADEAETAVSTHELLGGSAAEPTPATPAFPGITPLPQPGVGDAVEKGFRGLSDFLEEMKNARDLGPGEPKEQPWKMVVIEGTTTKELEFTKDARFGRVTADGNGGGGTTLEPPLPGLPPVTLPPVEESEESEK